MSFSLYLLKENANLVFLLSPTLFFSTSQRFGNLFPVHICKSVLWYKKGTKKN